jgi:hypothetical protein
VRSTSYGVVTIVANGAQIPSSNHELFVLTRLSRPVGQKMRSLAIIANPPRRWGGCRVRPAPATSSPFDTEATSLEAGEVLVGHQYLSVDPYHRFGLRDRAVTRSQFPVTQPGTITSTWVSRDPVYSWLRWERFTVVDEPNLQYLQKVKAGVDPVHHLGRLGAPGLTAHAGITRIAQPNSRETIVVSATTGAVGMVASQLAKRLA